MLDLIKMSQECPNVILSVSAKDLVNANTRLINDAVSALMQPVKDDVGDVCRTKEYVMTKLAVSESTLWRWKKSGYLVPINVGGQSRYKERDIQAIMEGKK